MAIMAVKIEDWSSLKMNEFFDFNGYCYGLSRSREKSSSIGAELEDFYECTVLTDWIEDIPVIFLCHDSGKKSDSDHGLVICGWYKQAKICRQVFYPSLFLEGNICARSTDAVLLREDAWIDPASVFHGNWMDFGDKLYRVIEDDEDDYEALDDMIKKSKHPRMPVCYGGVSSDFQKDRLRRFLIMAQKRSGKSLSAKEANKLRYEYCIEQCGEYARRLMSDECESIGDIKTLRDYAVMAITCGKDEPDGYYYKAMADEQLGFTKEGLKSVNQALKLEPDGADILALKANLLAEMKSYEDAVQLYGESYDISGDESYLLMQGRLLFLMGNVDGAYKVYRQIEDKTILTQAGINLKDMEHKWPFVAIRGLKNLLKKSSEK